MPEIRQQNEGVPSPAEAARRSVEVFRGDPECRYICWPCEGSFVWIAHAPGETGHWSGEEAGDGFACEYQHAQNVDPLHPPPKAMFRAVYDHWLEG